MTFQEFITNDTTKFFTPIFFGFILLEIISTQFFKARGEYELKDGLANMFLGISSGFVNGLAAFITLGALFWAQKYQIFNIPNTIGAFLACFIIDDLRFYIHHRIAHRCRWGWAMHVVHHSSQHFNLSVAYRQAWTKHFTGTMLLKVPLVLIGFDPVLVIFCGTLNASYQFFLHTEAIHRMPKWYEAIFNTPSHHRVHHSKNPQHLDSNYAGTLIIWDKMFGSFVPEEEDRFPDYGLVKDINTHNPFVILTHEYWGILKDIFGQKLSPKSIFAYIFAPPGWSHDGSRQTSDDIKREYFEQQTVEKSDHSLGSKLSQQT